jgi:hypothetical protein
LANFSIVSTDTEYTCRFGTTPYIPVQNGQATILSESDESVVLGTERVDTGKDMKMVFGVSRAFCEKARKRAQREPFAQQ